MTRRWLQSADIEIDDDSGALLVKVGDAELKVDMADIDVSAIVAGIGGAPGGKTLKDLVAAVASVAHIPADPAKESGRLSEIAGRLAIATALAGGIKTVAAAATPEALVATSTPCRCVWVGPLCNADGVGTNTKPVFLGDSGNQNMPLLPNSISGVVLSIDDAGKVYVKVGVNGEGVAYRLFT